MPKTSGNFARISIFQGFKFCTNHGLTASIKNFAIALVVVDGDSDESLGNILSCKILFIIRATVLSTFDVFLFKKQGFIEQGPNSLKRGFLRFTLFLS